jgi:hypothetical protein
MSDDPVAGVGLVPGVSTRAPVPPLVAARIASPSRGRQTVSIANNRLRPVTSHCVPSPIAGYRPIFLRIVEVAGSSPVTSTACDTGFCVLSLRSIESHQCSPEVNR